VRSAIERVAANWERAGYLAWIAVALALGLGLRWRALEGTLLADDFDHYAMHAGIYPVARGPLDRFDFVSGSADELRALLDFGRLPWWTAPDLKLSALRPLASALSSLDYGALGGVAERLHAHSMLWWALLLCGVAALLRELLPAKIGALALLLFALDEAHGLPLAWIANRSALIAVAFVTWSLWAHVAYRTRGLAGGRALSLLLLGLGLAAGEYALAPLAYFASFELLGMRDAPGRRLRALAPLAALAASYMLLHRALGYGLSGSGFYVDPLGTPLRFVSACAQRLPLLAGDLGFGLAAEWTFTLPPFGPWFAQQGVPAHWFELPTWESIQLAAGVAAIVALIGLLVWLRRSPRVEQLQARSAVWLLAGSLLSLLPMCSTLAMSRLTLAAAIGMDAALAVVLACALLHALNARSLPGRAGVAALAIALLGVHGVYAGMRARNDTSYYTLRSLLDERWVTRAELDDATIAARDVFVIAAGDWATQWALPFVRARNGRPMPRSSHLLSPAFAQSHRVTRSGRNLLDLELSGMPTPRAFAGSVYRPLEDPLRAGQRFRLARFDVLVLRAVHGQPVRMRFTFRKPLEDPAYLFVFPTRDGLRHVSLPPLGASVELGRPSPPRW